MKHALVVEDLPKTADWLAQALAEAFPGIRVSGADSLAAARTRLRAETPELALVDLGLPDGSGVDLIRDLNRRHPDCHCVVTTIYADDHHLFPALRAGAHGYLLKDQPREKVVAALQGMVAGEPPLSPAIAQRLLRVFGQDQSSGKDEDNAQLSAREREALTLIAKGFKLPAVAQQMGVTRNTAASFVKAIYRKLNISSRAEATLEAARLGLVQTRL